MSYCSATHMPLTSAPYDPVIPCMSEYDSDFNDDPEKSALRRLAALQRMREEARDGRRAAMLDSIEKLIEVETKMLRHARRTEGSKEGKPS